MNKAYCLECNNSCLKIITGEYPEIGEIFCSQKCLENYELRGDVNAVHP